MALRRRNTVELSEDSGPRPPAEYPFPTFQDQGEFAVPLELREDYVSARLQDGLVAGYWANGSYRAPIHTEGVKPILLMGDVEGAQRERMVHLEGEKDFALWIHLKRLDLAGRAVRSRAMMAPLVAMHEKTMECPACGTLVAPAGGVLTQWVVALGQNVSGCASCIETLAFLVGAEAVARHDSIEILQHHAREIVADKLGPVEIGP
jgi:hypothetical protein